MYPVVSPPQVPTLNRYLLLTIQIFTIAIQQKISIYKLLCTRYFKALIFYSYQLVKYISLFLLHRGGSCGSERVSLLSKVNKWLLRGRLGVVMLTQKLLSTHPTFCSVGGELRILQQSTNWSSLKLTKELTRSADQYRLIWTFFSLTTWFLLGTNLKIYIKDSVCLCMLSETLRTIAMCLVSLLMWLVKNGWPGPFQIPILWGLWLCCKILLWDKVFHIKIKP